MRVGVRVRKVAFETANMIDANMIDANMERSYGGFLETERLSL